MSLILAPTLMYTTESESNRRYGCWVKAPMALARQRQKQEHQEFKASLCYIESVMAHIATRVIIRREARGMVTAGRDAKTTVGAGMKTVSLAQGR